MGDIALALIVYGQRGERHTLVNFSSGKRSNGGARVQKGLIAHLYEVGGKNQKKASNGSDI